MPILTASGSSLKRQPSPTSETSSSRSGDSTTSTSNGKRPISTSAPASTTPRRGVWGWITSHTHRSSCTTPSSPEKSRPKQNEAEDQEEWDREAYEWRLKAQSSPDESVQQWAALGPVMNQQA